MASAARDSERRTILPGKSCRRLTVCEAGFNNVDFERSENCWRCRLQSDRIIFDRVPLSERSSKNEHAHPQVVSLLCVSGARFRYENNHRRIRIAARNQLGSSDRSGGGESDRAFRGGQRLRLSPGRVILSGVRPATGLALRGPTALRAVARTSGGVDLWGFLVDAAGTARLSALLPVPRRSSSLA